MRALGLLTIAAGLALAAGRASAQDVEDAADAVPADRDEEARALFEAGRVSYGAGRFDDALDYFARSHELSGRPELLFNLASCEERLRRDEDAIAHYRAFLAAIPDADNRTFVEERIAFLESTLETDGGPAAEAPPPEPLPEPESPSDDGWIWGVVIGGAVLVVGVSLGVGLGVGLSGTEAPYAGTAGFTVAALRFE